MSIRRRPTSIAITPNATLERIADSLERLVIAADSIATALALNAMVTRRIANQNEEQRPE